MSARINTFIVYAREDLDIKQDLVLHLNPLRNPDYNMGIWHDEYIEAGEEWQQKIKERLEQTDIFLLLISAHFMDSEFIREVEFEAAIDRHKTGKSIVIPVIIRPCLWKVNISLKNYRFSLNELQVLPDGAKPLNQWNTVEDGLHNIAEGVLKVLETLREREQIKQQEAEKQQIEERQKEEEKRKRAEKEKEEEQVWKNSLDANSKSLFKDYIKRFPDGKFSILAYSKIQEFETQENEASEKAKREAEKIAWNEANERNTINAYNKYLKAYPDSIYKKQANVKIAALEEEKEAEFWKDVKTKNTISSYNEYLQEYPQGKYSKQAKAKISELKNEAAEKKRLDAEKKESDIWKEAQSKSTISSYTKYIQTYPDGKYSIQAKAKINELNEAARPKTEPECWEEALRLNTYESYESYINKFRFGPHVFEARRRQSAFRGRQRTPGLQAQGSKFNAPIGKTGKPVSYSSAFVRKNFINDSGWWLLLPLIIALSTGAFFIGSYCFYTLYNALHINWSHHVPTSSWIWLWILGLAWGVVYAITGSSLYSNVTLKGLILPFENIFTDGDGSFLGGIFSAPVINVVVMLFLLNGIGYLFGLIGWDSNTLFTILFVIVNIIAMLVCCAEADS